MLGAPLAFAMLIGGGWLTFPGAVEATRADADLSRYVNPFIGTAVGALDRGTGGGGGNTFPGPVMPGGMIRMGPDTLPSTANLSGGYAYADRDIRGFSLLRMSGAGCTNYRDVPITPTTAPITGSPVVERARDVQAKFLSTFSHATEQSSPGYYQVALRQQDGEPIDVRLTSTLHAAAARFTFPASKAASLLVNAAGSAGDAGNEQATINIDPSHRELTGSETSGGFCLGTDRYRLYFALRFDRPFAAFGTWRRQVLSNGATQSDDALPGYPGPLGQAFRAQAGGYVSFDTTAGRTVEARVGISFVSVQGARRNLDSETAGLGFETIHQRARQAWNSVLSRVEVGGGPGDTRQRFYTALYQALIEPGSFSDVDGRYAGMDGRIHVADGYVQYANFSGWDVYRTQLPLLAIIRPDVASDVVRSLLADARQSGWLPKWSVANGQTEVMTGDPAAAAIASIYALGGRRFDTGDALRALIKGGTETGRSANNGYVERQALSEYLNFGYIPHELNGNATAAASDDLAGGLDQNFPSYPGGIPVPSAASLAFGSAGTTLEYATADFAVSQLARALGDRPTCRAFLARSGTWHNLFNPVTGYIEPRTASGQFLPGYDPNHSDVLSSQGFAEGDAAQYTWMVPFDAAGLFAAMGGPMSAIRRLDVFFARLNEGVSSKFAFLGNEPNSNAPWLYDWLGQPYKTQALVRRVLGQLYKDDPGGFPGNDDLGQMSAWYVLSAIGLYPAIPGVDVLALGSPLFPEIKLHLARGEVTLRAPGSADKPYVKSLRVNGRPYIRPWLRYSELSRGAHLDFTMSAAPDLGRGARLADAPPSFTAKAPKLCGPG